MTTERLSHRLRTETKDAHTAAERSGVMRNLLRGTISRSDYATLLVNLRALYDALETGILQNAEHPALAGVQWSALQRAGHITHDIAAMGETQSLAHSTHIIVPSTTEYVSRLHGLARTAPELLIVHAYLRYIGDMYGGQIIKRILLDKVMPERADAVSFYDFDDIGDMHSFMAEFRNVLDAVPTSIADADRMVAEALAGYELHARMFTELTPHATLDSGVRA